jgi:hypothetical protein
MSLTHLRLRTLLLATALPCAALALDVNNSVTADQVWRKGDSPVIVSDVVTIERTATLTIEPGVRVQFAAQAGLVVYGHLMAKGTAQDSIYFGPSEGSEPGSWGGLHLRNAEAPRAYDDNLTANGKGSTLEYCVIELGGNSMVEGGSTIGCDASSPMFAHSTIRNNLGVTGVIRCQNSAEPLFLACRIESNHATRGGAVSAAIGAKPRLRGCYVVNNQADDNGGGLYISLADADLQGNVFAGNRATNNGAVIFAARVSELTIVNNFFAGNVAGSGSNAIFITEQVNSRIESNSFDPVGSVVYLKNAQYPVEAGNNFWGLNPAEVNFRDVIRDKFDSPAEPLVSFTPAMFAPFPTTPANPVELGRIYLCRTDEYQEEIPRGVADGAPLRIRLDGRDADPDAVDVIPVKVTSALDPDGIVIPLYETTPNSGNYTGRGIVKTETSQEDYAIGDLEGGSVTITSPIYPDKPANYKTLTPKPVVEQLAIPTAKDVLHLTDHNPHFTWTYYEPVDRPQKSFKVEIEKAAGGRVWSSGETRSGEQGVDYTGSGLVDGESYTVTLSANSGKFWSDEITLAIRMNALPSAPVPIRPPEAALVPTRSPQAAISVSTDSEGDALTYNFVIEDVSGATEPQSVNGLQGASEVVWTPPTALTENGTYRFRAMAADPFEPGPWGDYRLFHINSVEEPANPFDIVGPTGSNVYDLHPTLSWERAIDPDPLSSVTYTVEIAKGANWPTGRKYENIIPTQFMLPDSLDNKSEYSWRVTSTDNTGRKTVSTRTGKFLVETTPSVPEAVGPLNGAERKPQATFSWLGATDPNPADVLTYEIEVYKGSVAGKPLATLTGKKATSVAVDQLTGWEVLTDNTVYIWRVRARDNHNAAGEFCAPGSFFFNKTNDTPTPPALVSGPGDLITGSTSVPFAWKHGSDADQSDSAATLVCEIEAVVGQFDTPEVRKFRSEPGAESFSGNLDDNRLWQYRLRTVDDDGAASGWTPVRKVLVNVAEDSPTPFALQSPTDNAPIAELDSLLFTWGASSDPDWASSVKYRLELTGPDGKIFKTETSATSYMFKGGLTNASTYRWTVKAIDNTARETSADREFAFNTNTTPTAPSIADLGAELLPAGRLIWMSSSDPNPRDRLVYSLELSLDQAFGVVAVKKDGLGHVAGSMTIGVNELTGWDKLQDDKDYFLRVKATDNHGYASVWSTPKSFRYNSVNDNPTLPGAPYAPTASAVVTDRMPILKWAAAADEDLSDPASSLIYDIRIDSDGELVKNAAYEFSSTPGAVEFRTPMPLTDNTPWVWSVRARDDGNGVSAWSPPQSFLLNVQEDAPSAPIAMKPYNGQTMNILGPVQFAWIRSIDQDYKSSVTYRLTYGLASNLSDGTVVSDLKDSTYTVKGPLENSSYYWRVTAIDNTGLQTESSIATVILDTRPTVPQPALPTNGVELKPDGRFAWSGSADPNPADKITYTLQISGSNGFESLAFESKGLKETTLAMNAPALKGKLTDNSRYFWRVSATDDHAISSAFSPAAEFAYNEKNDAPGQFSLGSPANGSSIPRSDVSLSWAKATDPDPGSRVTYTLIVARDAKLTDRQQRFSGLSGESFTLPASGLEEGATYYWKVSAEDGLGGVTYGSESDKTPWSFSIPVPPPPPAPAEPVQPTPEPGAGAPGK